MTPAHLSSLPTAYNAGVPCFAPSNPAPRPSRSAPHNATPSRPPRPQFSTSKFYVSPLRTRSDSTVPR